MDQETDMIYNTEDGNTRAGGYSVESLLLNQGMSALYSANSGGGKDEKVSDRFKHLAVPAGLFYMHENINNSARINDKNDSNIINDDLYEKLLKLAEHDNKDNDKSVHNKTKQPKKTKKRSNKVNKRKTKRKH